MRSLVVMAAMLALSCQWQEKQGPAPQPASAGVPGSPESVPAELRVGSPAFHLEMGGVYERFRDPKTAADHYAQAAEAATQPGQRVQAWAALGNVKDGLGDRAGAIAAFERAVAELEKTPADAPPPAAAAEFVARVADLYVRDGKYADAQQVCQAHAAAFADPWQRERLYRLEVQIQRVLGTLEKTIADLEKAAAQPKPDEAALRFLAVAFDAGVLPAAPTQGGKPDDTLAKLIQVYETLLRLHPEDAQVRTSLQGLLERTGRIDDAVKLATSAAATVSGAECFAAATAGSPALGGGAEAVRIRMRAGQREAAQALTATLVAQNEKAEAIPARLLATQLYLEQGRMDLADRMLEEAAKRAISAEDARRVAFARAQALRTSGRSAELKALDAEWLKSSDPCYRLVAQQHEQERTLAAAAPTLPTLPPPHPR